MMTKRPTLAIGARSSAKLALLRSCISFSQMPAGLGLQGRNQTREPEALGLFVVLLSPSLVLAFSMSLCLAGIQLASCHAWGRGRTTSSLTLKDMSQPWKLFLEFGYLTLTLSLCSPLLAHSISVCFQNQRHAHQTKRNCSEQLAAARVVRSQ